MYSPNLNKSENVARVVYRSTELTTKSPAPLVVTTLVIIHIYYLSREVTVETRQCLVSANLFTQSRQKDAWEKGGKGAGVNFPKFPHCRATSLVATTYAPCLLLPPCLCVITPLICKKFFFGISLAFL